MTKKAELIPDYLSTDFLSVLEKMKEYLKEDATFKDYNYEGSNIAVLLELKAYISELTTFYLNQLAKNAFMESADVYECVNALANVEMGYDPKGFRSSTGTVSLIVSGAYLNTLGEMEDAWRPGDQLFIPTWSIVDSGLKSSDGTAIIFSTTKDTLITVPSSASGTIDIEIPMVQGEPYSFENYSGKDLVSNQLILPLFNYAFGTPDDPEAEITIEVFVNDEKWERVNSFYDVLSGLITNDNVYKFRFDKYKRYIVEFSNTRNVPKRNESIKIYCLRTLGLEGNVAANTLTNPTSTFLRNLTLGKYLTSFTCNNINSTVGGANIETIAEIKSNATGKIFAQNRNVQARDYESHLESRTDVISAVVWGEQDIAPSGSVTEYNKVHVAVIPSDWGTSTISVSGSPWIPTPGISGSTFTTLSYNEDYKNALKIWLEPRKMLNQYETFDLPDLIFFALNIGLKTKRMYQFNSVANDVKNKLLYYFLASNRSFSEVIDFKEIHNYIIDPSFVSENDEFKNIKGIENLIFRDIITNKNIYSYGSVLYPQYAQESFDSYYDNVLRPIKLGFMQFPILLDSFITIRNEG